MRHILTLLLATAALANAADIATWGGGPGTIDGVKAVRGTAIADHVVAASGKKPALVTLAKAPKTRLYLAPDSSISIAEKDGGVIVSLLTGTIQADVEDKGPYQDLHVTGAVFDVRVTGTLFLVERVKADTDYIALIEGRVKVSLREEVAKALGREAPPMELNGRQGLEANLSGGFGSVASLTSQPVLPSGGDSRSVRNQGSDGTGAPWSGDVPEVKGGPSPSIGAGVTEQVRETVVETVSNNVTQQVQNQVQETVIQTITSPAPLGAPPGPPAE
jgi:hypothetical protein